MDFYANGDKIALAKDVANENLAYGIPFVINNPSNTFNGSTQSVTNSATSDNDNWHYFSFKTVPSFKKGDVITISAIGYLTGKQVKDGNYKATIYNTDLSTCYDDTENSIFLKSGKLSSKTFIANADSDPNNPPILMFYTGIAGSCGGNTLTIKNAKAEKSSIATPWIPSINDIAKQSDVTSLQDKINNLFSAKYSPLIDNTNDLNTVPLGFVRSFGSKPQNAPNGLNPWAIYLTIAMDETENTLIQLGIDSDGNILGRTKGGSPAKWNEWFAISQR